MEKKNLKMSCGANSTLVSGKGKRTQKEGIGDKKSIQRQNRSGAETFGKKKGFES